MAKSASLIIGAGHLASKNTPDLFSTPELLDGPGRLKHKSLLSQSLSQLPLIAGDTVMHDGIYLGYIGLRELEARVLKSICTLALRLKENFSLLALKGSGTLVYRLPQYRIIKVLPDVAEV